MNETINRVRLFLKLSRPYLLIGALVQMLLGSGIAKFLGNSIDWTTFWLGTLWVVSVQLGSQYLHEYFDLYTEANPEEGTWSFSGSPALGTEKGKLPRRSALVAAAAAWTGTGAITIILFSNTMVGLSSSLLMGLIFATALAISVPPLRLYRSGYGELVIAIFLGFLVPAFGFSLQTGGIHRLLSMTALPLVLAAIPVMLALTFPFFASDQKNKRLNMLQKLGWENSMVIHNTLILLAYLSLAGVIFLGYPRTIGLTAFLSFPSGLIQIWLMRRVADGAKPVWSAIRFNAISMIGLMILTFLYSFWTR